MPCTTYFFLRRESRLDARAPAGLLLTTATHVCLNRLRSERRRPEDPDDDLLVRIASLGHGLYRKIAAGVERLGAAARVRPGDIVQVRYIAAGRSYGVVASCDADGAVTLHLPEAPGQAVALVKDGERALAHAYEFDNSPGFERFVFVTAEVPFATDLVVRILKQGAALPNPSLAGRSPCKRKRHEFPTDPGFPHRWTALRGSIPARSSPC
jgi:hypothetical protein